MSRFGDILKNAKRGPAPDGPPADPPPPATLPPAGASAPPSPAPARGRPRGKRSDPAFDQVTAYIPGELYRKVRIALLEDARGQEFSELVAELLAGWLATRPRG